MITLTYTATDTDLYPMVLFDNLYSRGTVSESTYLTGYPGSNVGTETTYDYWTPTAIPANVKVDMTTATSADSCAIVAHTLGSSGSTVLLQWSTDNIAWTTVTTVNPTDDTPILILFTSVSKRYWRINITASTLTPIIGCVVLGAKTVFPGGVMPPYTPIWQAQTVDLLVAKSLGGQFLGNRILRQGAETSINLVPFSKTYAESTLQTFKSWYNGGHAFVWASGPSVFTNDVGYVWRKSGAEMRPTFTDTGNWVKVNMEVEGYVQ